jgi:hypothetical protein
LNIFGVPITTFLIISYKIYTLPSASMHPGWRYGFAYLILESTCRPIYNIWHYIYDTILAWGTLLNENLYVILEYNQIDWIINHFYICLNINTFPYIIFILWYLYVIRFLNEILKVKITNISLFYIFKLNIFIYAINTITQVIFLF